MCLLHADLNPAHEQAVAAAARGTGYRRVVLVGGVAGVPGVRADGHHGRERLPAPGLPTVSRGARRPGRRGARHDVRRRTGAGSRAVPGSPPRCCSRARPAGCGPARPSPPPAATPMPSPSTWAARAPTCASCEAGCPSRRRGGRWVASRCACRRSTSTRSAPAEDRSPASIPAGPWLSARRAPAPIPARPAMAGAVRRRRSRTPTSCSAGSRPTPRSRVLVDSTRAAAALGPGRVPASMPTAWWRWSTPPWSRPYGPSPWSAASIPAAWLSWPSVAPAPSMPAPWPTLWACRPWSCRPGPACSRPWACCARPGSGSWSVPGPRRPTTPGSRRRCGPWEMKPAKRSAASDDVEVLYSLDCRYQGQSHELTVQTVEDVSRRAPAPQRLRPARRSDRGGGPAGPGPATRSPRTRRPALLRSGSGWSARRWRPRPIAPSGSPKDGRPSLAPPGPG